MAGAVVVGGARMDTNTTDINAQLSQGGGSLCRRRPVDHRRVGFGPEYLQCHSRHPQHLRRGDCRQPGNGILNINSGNVVVSGTAGLSIGGDPTGATAGNVNLSSGTIDVTGDLILGNGGVGSLNQSGGVLTVTGSLVAAAREAWS